MHGYCERLDGAFWTEPVNAAAVLHLLRLAIRRAADPFSPFR